MSRDSTVGFVQEIRRGVEQEIRRSGEFF